LAPLLRLECRNKPNGWNRRAGIRLYRPQESDLTVTVMKTTLQMLWLVALVAGCRGPIRTESTVRMAGPLETRVTTEFPPPVPDAGAVRPVVVQPGTGPDRVAILDVDGLLLNFPFNGPGSVGENPVALFREKLDAIEADGCVKAVVLRVNSPGGGVAACVTMRRDLERFKARTGKPVVACLLDTATGGAYYLASAADHVVAGPATVTGGVGVILNLYNLQDLMAQFNIFPQPVKAGPMIDVGSSARKLRPEEETLLQTMADEFHDLLKSDIRKARPYLELAGGTTFDGRIFTGSQARHLGLVDRVGDLDAAIQLASGSCGGSPAVVLYRRANDPARSPHAVTANIPMQGAGFLPNVPGLDRSKLPTFLSLWQPEMTMEKLGGK
jgi:protease-4